MTSKFIDLDKVCSALGLQWKLASNGHMWKGFIGSNHVRIVIHDKALGRDIPNGTFHKYVKELGFANEQVFFEYLEKL